MNTLINRRGFLQGGLVATAAATVSLAKKSEAATFEGYPNAMGVLVDLSRNRSRMFCDTGNCGNRQHVAAYRERRAHEGK